MNKSYDALSTFFLNYPKKKQLNERWIKWHISGLLHLQQYEVDIYVKIETSRIWSFLE